MTLQKLLDDYRKAVHEAATYDTAADSDRVADVRAQIDMEIARMEAAIVDLRDERDQLHADLADAYTLHRASDE